MSFCHGVHIVVRETGNKYRLKYNCILVNNMHYGEKKESNWDRKKIWGQRWVVGARSWRRFRPPQSIMESPWRVLYNRGLGYNKSFSKIPWPLCEWIMKVGCELNKKSRTRNTSQGVIKVGFQYTTSLYFQFCYFIFVKIICLLECPGP